MKRDCGIAFFSHFSLFQDQGNPCDPSDPLDPRNSYDCCHNTRRGPARASAGVSILILLSLLLLSCGKQEKVLREDEITAVLSGKTLRIEVPGDSFETDRDVRVSDILMADINNDSTPDVLALCEKRGSYGSHLPFYVEENDNEIAQHIFIYSANEKRGIYPIWMSSAIPQNISEWKLEKDPESGRQILILYSPDGTETRWFWDYFGLKEAPF